MLRNTVNQNLDVLLGPYSLRLLDLIKLRATVLSLLQERFEIFCHQHRFDRLLFEVFLWQNFWEVFQVKAAFAKDVALSHFFENFMDRRSCLSHLFNSAIWVSFSVPLLVVADITTEVANWRVRWGDSFDFLASYQIEIILRALRLSYLAVLRFHLLVEDLLDALCLGNVDIALWSCLYDLSWYIAALS